MVDHDHQVILKTLGEALRDGAAALADQSLRSPAAAFRAVAAADLALADAPRFLDALDLLVRLSEPGDYVTAELRRHAEQFTGISREVAPYREQLDTLLDAEKRLRAAASERDEIMGRIAELRRVETLAASTADLRAQRDALEDRADMVSRAAADATVSIALASQELISITGDLLEALGDEVRELVRQAADQDRLLQARLAERKAKASGIAAEQAQLKEQLATAESEAAAAESAFEQAYTATSARLAALTRYAAANRAISTALTVPTAETGPADGLVAGPAAGLEEAERRLGEVDNALAEALAEHERLRQAAQSVLHPPTATGPASPEEK
jgi:chromosome segregation ATPase